MTARTLPDDFRYPPASDEQIEEMQDQIAEYSAGDKSVATRIDWLGAFRRLLPMYWKYRADAEYWKSWQDADKIKALETENARLLAIAQEQRGAMAADEERTRAAAMHVWGDHVRGCDTADAMADLIVRQRAEIAKLQGIAQEQRAELKIKDKCIDELIAASVKLSGEVSAQTW